jgi:hypothetical protein
LSRARCDHDDHQTIRQYNEAAFGCFSERWTARAVILCLKVKRHQPPYSDKALQLVGLAIVVLSDG